MIRACVLLMLLSSVASARTRTVILPAVTGRDPAEARIVSTVERSLIDAAQKIASIEISNLDGAKLRGPHVDPKADPRPQARAQALARELSAELAIFAETQPLGEGAVVYLQIVDTGGKSRGSTTVAISGDAMKTSAEIERLLRGGLTQVLEPARFVGKLDLRIDVKGAQVEVDGRNLGSAGVFDLPVGTHAVRVTHPAYHDFLRFVEVGFDRATTETIALAAFPLTEGEMAEKRALAPIVRRKLPWYRSWWALGVGGLVLAGATVGIVFLARPGLSADHETHYSAQPAP